MPSATESQNDAVALFETLGLDNEWRDLPAGQTIRRRGLELADTVHGSDTEPRAPAPRAMDLIVPSAATLGETLAALPLVPVDDASAGQTAADLAVTGKLGEGGMGVVQRVQQRSLAREVAVKRIRQSETNPRSVQALLAEARIAGALEHPNIVPIHALGRDQHGNPVLVMKRVEGVPWLHLIHDDDHPHWQELGDDPQRFHLETLMQVCRAVELAHSRSVIHRDLKPENVMVGRFGEVYVLDWGIATVLEKGKECRGVAGTPAYMAPEMATGEPLSPRTDGYLLGAILHEVLTGRPPHSGTTLLQALASMMDGAPFEFAPDTPSELAAICTRALEPKPEDRFESVSDLRKSLATYLAHRESSSLADDALRRLTELDESPGPRRAALGEIQFVLRQALQLWAGNEPADRGLALANDELVKLDLAANNLDSAEALLATYEAPDALRVALEAARSETVAERERIAKLESVAAEHDVGGFWLKRRRRVVAGAAGLTLLPLCAWGPVMASEGGVTYAHLIFASSVLALLGVVGLVALRRRRDLELRSRVVTGLAPLLLLSLPVVLLGWRAGIEPGLMAGLVTLLFASGMFLLAALVHAVFWVPSFAFLLAGVAGMLWPEHAVTATVAADLATVAIGVRMLLARPVDGSAEGETGGPTAT